MANCSKLFNKDPSSVLDYKFDWAALSNGTGTSNWLGSGEVIDSFTLTPDAGITIDSSSLSDGDTSVTVWLSGGTDRQAYDILCHITTNSVPARQEDRTMIIKMGNR